METSFRRVGGQLTVRLAGLAELHVDKANFITGRLTPIEPTKVIAAGQLPGEARLQQKAEA